MFKPVRLIATLVFLGSIGLVFVGAFVLGNEVRQSYFLELAWTLKILPLDSLHR
jgi:hypothetical protein